MNPTRYFLLILTALSLFAPNARAAFAAIGVGTSANDGTGDTLRAAFVKVNDNFDLSVLNSAGSATNLTIVGGSFSAITNTTLTASKPVFSAADKSLTSTGTVPVDQGGTGLTSHTLNAIPYASGTTTLTSGSTLTFNAGALYASGSLSLGSSGGGTINLGENASGNGTSRLNFTGSNSVINWRLSQNDSISGAFEIAPSTVAGTNTFSSPLIVLSSALAVGINTGSPLAQLAVNGGVHVGGDSDPGDNNLAVDGTSTLTGAVTHSATTIYTSASIQTLVAGSPVVASATKVIVAGSGGPITTTATPSIADGTDGQMLYVVGTNDTNTLELQDEGTLASSNLALGSTSRVLGLGDVLVLMYDTTAASWIEVSFTNN